MNLKAIKPKAWREYRERLAAAIEDEGLGMGERRQFGTPYGMKFVRYVHDEVAIESYRIPVVFNTTTRELYVWSKASRYSHERVSVYALYRIQLVFKKWLAEIEAENEEDAE